MVFYDLYFLRLHTLHMDCFILKDNSVLIFIFILLICFFL